MEINVSNTQAMAVLLEAIGLRKYQYTPTGETITINVSKQELTYAINSSSETIQSIYGETDEWKQLINLF